jgi:preprotein translocase subunit SecE
MANKKSKREAKRVQQQQQTQKGGLVSKLSEFKEFFEQSKVEMKKVTYPSQKQTLATCGSVLVLVFILSVFLGLVDVALSKILQVILQ